MPTHTNTTHTRITHIHMYVVLLCALFFVSVPHAHALTISGTLYSDEGSNAITSGKTIKMAVGTSTPATIYTTTSNGSGVYSFTIASLNTVTPLVLWVDGDTATRAALFTKSSSTVNDITSLPLYKDHIIIRHEGTSGTSTTNADLAFYDGDQDSDIMYTVDSASTTLTVTDLSQELYIQTGKTYEPNGNTILGHVENIGTLTAPTTTLTIGGNFINTGTFTHGGGSLKFTGMGTYATGTLTNTNALNDVTVQGGGVDVFGTAVDTSAIEVLSLVVDSQNGVLYAGTSNTGVIYRCLLSTGCDASGDFTTAYDTPEVQTFALTIDTQNSVLYAGTGNGGIIYRCALSTGCDAAGDFTTAYDTTEGYIFALTIDTTNGVLYAGSGNGGIIHRCLLSTGCDAGTDFTTAYDTTELYIRSLTVDTVHGVLYAGSSAGGIIYRCLTSTGCDASGDFTTAYDTAQGEIYFLTIDTQNNVLYAGTDGGGVIYRCALSTDCDASGDFTTAYDTPETYTYAATIDTANNILYVGTYPNGIIYRCALSTGCDTATDFNTATDTPESYIYSLAIDQTNGSLYAGAATNGIIYRRGNDFTFGANASTTGDLVIATTKRLTAPNQLTIGGDYINGGTFVHSSGTVTMSSSTAHSIMGNTATSSAFYNLVVDGVGSVGHRGTFSSVMSATESFFQYVSSFAIDQTNRVLYVGGSDSGGALLYRCVLSSGCTDASDFTLSANYTALGEISILESDSVNGVLYIGTSADGIVYRCAYVTGCDEGTDFTSAYNTAETGVSSLKVDSTNGVLYIGTGSNGVIFRCVLSTGCDASGDFATAYDPAGAGGNAVSFTIDESNNVLYVVTEGILYSCLLSTSCDASGDFTTATSTSFSFNKATIDQIHDVLYITTYDNASDTGIIYRCLLSTACNASSDFTTVYTTSVGTSVYSLAIDTLNDILYIGGSSFGPLYRCALNTGCDTQSDFVIFQSNFETVYNNNANQIIFSIYIDDVDDVLYMGTGYEGNFYKCSLVADCAAFSTSTTLTNLTMSNGSSYTLNEEVRILGNYVNNGTSSIDVAVGTTTLVFAGSGAQSISGNLTATSALPYVTFIGSGTKTFTAQASIVADFAIGAGSTVVAPTSTLTIAGTYTNSGTFTHNGGSVIFTGISGVATGTMTGTSAFNDVVIQSGGGGRGVFTEVYSPVGQSYITSLIIDTANNVLYMGTYPNGIIYRCALSTGCDASGDFTTAYDTTESGIHALIVDQVNGVLYAGSGSGGIIYRCLLSTNCDAAGDFTTAYDTPEKYIWSFAIDTANAVLYAGAGTSSILYRCALSTGCDQTSDFSTATDTADIDIDVLVIDPAGAVMYVGTNGSGTIYRCALSTSCDSSTDFAIAYIPDPFFTSDTPSMIIDGVSRVLYVGSYLAGIIFRCELSTGCDAQGDFTAAYGTLQEAITSFTIDTVNRILYAGSGYTGKLYQCNLVTENCDSSDDFTIAYDAPKAYIEELVFDSANGVLYAGGSQSGVTLYRRANDFTFGANASTTGDLTITPTKRLTAPSSLTIGGDYVNAGTFVNATGTVTLSSSTVHTITGNTATSSAFYGLTIDGTGPVAYQASPFTVATDTMEFSINSLTIDTTNGVLYAGGGDDGIIYRCPLLSTGCDTSGDFTTAYDTTGTQIVSLTIDTQNSVLYAGAAGGGTIYRCLLSTSCDESTDFTTAYSGVEYSINSLVIDTTNGVLYIGTSWDGVIYRCALSTGCDISGDFTVATDTPESDIYSLTIDTQNSVLYAGTAGDGIIYRCQLNTGCDGVGEFTTATNTPETDVRSLTIDTQNGVLYAGSGVGGIIYRCALSTGCDSGGDFTIAYNTTETVIDDITIDSTNGVLYAGSGLGGIIYRCTLNTNCDTSGDFTIAIDTAEEYIHSLTIDTTNGVLYAGSYPNGLIYRCPLSTGCLPSSTSTTLTNLSINSGATFTQNNETRIAGNFTNNGTTSIPAELLATTTSTYPNIILTGASAQSLSGNFTGSSTLPHLMFTGNGAKTFSSNASTTNFTITSGSTVVAPSSLTVAGNYSNAGTFTNNSGTVTFTNMGGSATGTMTGTSAFNNVALKGGGVDTFSTAYDTAQTNIYALIVDQTNRVLYAGASAGIIYRCDLKTSYCGSSSDFTTAYDSVATNIYTFAIDSTNGVLYAGSGATGIIYRCALSTNCDAAGDFTTAYDTTETSIYSLIIDTTNGVLYAGSGSGGIIYRCALSTSCDAAGDFSTAYDTTESYIDALTIDTTNGVLYAGTASNGIIYRCALSTSCDASGDFTTAYDTTESNIYFLNVDSVHNVLYIATGVSGIIYRCDLSTGCDASGDFTTAYDTTETSISSVVFDTVNNILYAGSNGEGIIYRCDLSTNCDTSGDFTVAVNTTQGTIDSLVVDQSTGAVFGGSLGGGIIYRRPNATTIGNTASTTNLTIDTGKRLIASSTISLTGNFTNNGTFDHRFGTTTFRGTSTQTATGTMTGTSAFKNIEITNTSGAGSSTQSVIFGAKASTTGNFNMYASTSAQFMAGATSTFQNIHLEGAATRYAWLRSSQPGTQYNFYVPGTQNLVNYVNVQDSNACPTTISATTTSVNAGNNTCWSFPIGYADLSSAANQTFTYGQATTTISTITVTDEATGPSITAANDIRIVIATTTLNMRWDTTDTLVTLGGTAAAKASTTVSYEADGAVLVINVTSDFAAGDTLTLSGLSYAQFGSVAFPDYLGIRVTGPGTTTQNFDNNGIIITGTLTLADHTLGQVSNALSGNAVATTTLFAFKLTPQYESFQVATGAFTFTLSGTQSMSNSDFTNVALYRDMNSDRQYDAGDIAVGGTAVVAIPSIWFVVSFNATTSQDYILVGTVSNLKPGDAFTMSIAQMSGLGVTSVGSVPISGTAQSLQHIRPGMGSSGTLIGGAAPQGQGVTTGGGSDAGDTIGSEPGFNAPTTNGTPYSTWTAGANAYTSDGVYTTTTGTGAHSYGTFGFSVPSNNTITGIAIKLEASASTNAGTLSVKLSWDGGTSVTALKTTDTLTATDTIYTLGSGSDTWGHTWTPTELTNGNFTIELISNASGNTVQVDALQVRVYHQASGGGKGGGGAVYNGQSQYFANVYSSLNETLRRALQRMWGWLGW